MYSKEMLFMLILIYLGVITGITGLLNEAQAGTVTIANLGDLSFGTISDQVTPNFGATSSALGSSTIITVEDFTNSSNYNKSTIQTMAPHGIPVIYNPWTQYDGIGYQLTGNLPLTTGHFGVVGVQEINGVYDVNYFINNTVNSNFNFDISQYGYIAQVQFTPTSISVYEAVPPSSSTPTGIKTIGLASANQYGNLITGVSEVETIYNPSTEALTINLNGGASNGGSTMQTTLDSSIGPATQNVPPYIFAGVEANTNGFVVQQIYTTVQTAAPGTIAGKTGVPAFDAILQAGSNLLSAIVQWGAFLQVFFGLSTYSAVPFWLWAITGVPCIAVLFLIGLELFRGVTL